MAQTPETYLGAQRADAFAANTAGALADGTAGYRYPAALPQNAFALTGTWTVASESVTSGAGAGIELNFDADDVYLDVGGTGTL
jgi:hypothetical protein